MDAINLWLTYSLSFYAINSAIHLAGPLWLACDSLAWLNLQSVIILFLDIAKIIFISKDKCSVFLCHFYVHDTSAKSTHHKKGQVGLVCLWPQSFPADSW